MIIPDASLGSTVTPNGLSYDIGGGTVIGTTNQFHSFSQFDVDMGDTANFTGPPSVINILSRVNDPSSNPSMINGTIKSSINGANLWFINPNGVVFGVTSSIDITGSLHVSTADSLLDGNGGAFYADPTLDPGNSLLFIGDPNAFGFLNAPTNDINLNSANLSVGPNQTISLVGKEVRLDASRLIAPGGRLNLISVGSAGSITLQPDGIDNSSIIYTGNEQVSMTNNSVISTDWTGGGSIFIRGGQFVMGPDDYDEETVSANTTGASNGGIIDIQIENAVAVRGQIKANTSGTGTGGDINIVAARVDVTDPLGGISQSQIQTMTTDYGNAGTLTISAGNIQLVSGNIDVSSEGAGNAGDIQLSGTDLLIDAGTITSKTNGSGIGGNINIVMGDEVILQKGTLSATTSGIAGTAGNIFLTANSIRNLGTDGFTLTTDTSGTGSGGNISLIATSSIFFDGGTITSSTSGAGIGGSVSLSAPAITLTKNIDSQAVNIITVTSGAGNAGSINLTSQDFELSNEAYLEASTTGSGNAGSIDVNLTGQMDLTADSSIVSFSDGAGSGGAGNVAVRNADSVNIDGKISTSSINSGGIAGSITFENIADATIGATAQVTSTTDGTSNAGNVQINDLQNLVLDGDISTSTSGSGTAGTIIFSNIPDATISGTGQITSATSGAGNAGNIAFNGPGNVTLAGVTASTASLAGASGNGGSITIGGNDFELAYYDNGSGGTGYGSLSASTQSTGNAGDIHFIDLMDLIVLDNPGVDGEISTSTTGGGNAGTITFSNNANMTISGTGQITSTTNATGNAGSIAFNGPGNVTVDGVTMSTGSTGSVSCPGTSSCGNGGLISITGNDFILTNGASLSASTSGIHDAGNIDIIDLTGQLDVAVGTSIESTSNGLGNAGNIQFNDLNNLFVDGGITTSTTAGGAAGTIIFGNIADATISGVGQITSATSGAGNAGDIQFTGPGNITIDGVIVSTESLAGASGNGGSISLGGNGLELANGGKISANTYGTGAGGIINISVNNLSMNSGGLIEVTASGTGDAGSIDIQASDSIFIDNSSITSYAANSNGGDIHIGKTGPVNPFFLIMQQSTINADAKFNGGNIYIYAQHILGSENTITATGGNGNNGVIVFDVPVDDLVSVVTVLDTPFLNVAAILNERCAANAVKDRSSFVVDADPLPPAPNDYLPSVFLLPPISKALGQRQQLGANGRIPDPTALSMRRVGCL